MPCGPAPCATAIQHEFHEPTGISVGVGLPTTYRLTYSYTALSPTNLPVSGPRPDGDLSNSGLSRKTSARESFIICFKSGAAEVPGGLAVSAEPSLDMIARDTKKETRRTHTCVGRCKCRVCGPYWNSPRLAYYACAMLRTVRTRPSAVNLV